MASELVSLIKQDKKEHKYDSSKGNEDEDTEILNLDLITNKNEDNYESIRVSSSSDRKQERIKFSWSKINVFTLQRNIDKLNYLKFWKQRKEQFAGKQLLKNVSGVAYPGELLAILGTTGTGKTTLLNALTGRTASHLIVTGLQSVNGIPISPKKLTGKLAYVQQDDLFIGSLTVKEHLIFQARVRMDANVSFNQRMERVSEVIHQLGLANCENTLIGIPDQMKGISGGEMRRLSFASEVLTNPPIMFCDEPTTGLDSFMALSVVQVLSQLAHSGNTVVCTIHQPSSEQYALFDKLMLMAEGRVAFFGTRIQTEDFFTSLDVPCPYNYNPADYYIQLLSVTPKQQQWCRQAVNMLCDKFECSEIGVKVAVEAATVHLDSTNYYHYLSNGNIVINRYKASWIAQFRTVLWRSWLTNLKNPLMVKLKILQTFILAFIITVVYHGQGLTQDGIININGVLFVFVMVITFAYCPSAADVFCAEIPLFLREHRSGMYRVDVYFLCKTLAELPLFTIIPVLFISLCYFSIGLNAELPKFMIAVLIAISIANISVSYGYLIAAITNSTSLTASLIVPLITPLVLLGGFFLNVDSIPVYVKPLSYLSWFRYSNEAFLINQWEDVENINCSFSRVTCARNGHAVLQINNFSEDHLSMNMIALASLCVGFRMLTYLSLLIRSHLSN